MTDLFLLCFLSSLPNSPLHPLLEQKLASPQHPFCANSRNAAGVSGFCVCCSDVQNIFWMDGTGTVYHALGNVVFLFWNISAFHIKIYASSVLYLCVLGIFFVLNFSLPFQEHHGWDVWKVSLPLCTPGFCHRALSSWHWETQLFAAATSSSCTSAFFSSTRLLLCALQTSGSCKTLRCSCWANGMWLGQDSSAAVTYDTRTTGATSTLPFPMEVGPGGLFKAPFNLSHSVILRRSCR